jgi:hypothetical protein
VAHTVAKTSLDFHPDLPVEIEFDAPHISSDGGALLLAQLDDRLGLCDAVASFVPDERDPSLIEHRRVEQLRQRVFGLMLGYDDQNDATHRRIDPVFKAACRKLPDGAHLSSQPTLSLFDNAVGDEANALVPSLGLPSILRKSRGGASGKSSRLR